MKSRPWNSISLLVLALLVMGSRPECDGRQSTLTCVDMDVTVAPGECVDITNPCDPTGEWSRVDGFRLCDAPSGIFVRTNRSRDGTTRQICATANVASLDSVQATYIYSVARDFGEGTISISTTTTAGVLAVTVSASQSLVNAGDVVDLTAVVSGGSPPYFYAWSSDPVGQITTANSVVPNPVVNPTVNARYSLLVTDGDVHEATDEVSIAVILAASIPTVVDTLDPGQSVQLLCQAEGGDGNYSFSWTPAVTLDDPAVANPIATPAVTTTYVCTLSDGAGASDMASIEVPVRGTTPGLGACFITSPGNPRPAIVISFDATCSAGTISEYHWWFYSDPDVAPPDVTTTNPVTLMPFDLPGTYPVTLEVVEQGTAATARVSHDIVVQ
jgi:hypothetical protein